MEELEMKQLKLDTACCMIKEIDKVKAAIEPLGYTLDDFKIRAIARMALEKTPGSDKVYTPELLSIVGYKYINK